MESSRSTGVIVVRSATFEDGKLKTYWLESKNGTPRVPVEDLTESRRESSVTIADIMEGRESPAYSVYGPVDDVAVNSSRPSSRMSAVK